MPGRAPEPSLSRVDDDGGEETFRGIMIGDLGFSDEGVYMGEGLTSGEPCGPHTTSQRAGGGTRAARWCGGSTAPLRLSFGLRVCDGEILTGVFVPCNSEYFLCRFSETKNSRKQETGTGYLVNRLVQENVNKCNKMHIKHVTNDII